jgi:hypothetical protein
MVLAAISLLLKSKRNIEQKTTDSFQFTGFQDGGLRFEGYLQRTR